MRLFSFHLLLYTARAHVSAKSVVVIALAILKTFILVKMVANNTSAHMWEIT